MKQFKKLITKCSSLWDQAITSGGNFLTIAVCAKVLPVAEQGKLGYVISIYMAALLINVSAIFQWGAAYAPRKYNNISYKNNLILLQIVIALLVVFVSTLYFYFFGKGVSWEPSLVEFLLLGGYLFFHQLADFDRRSSYFFVNSQRAVLSSALLYPIRIALLLIVSPENICDALAVLFVSTLVSASFTIKFFIQQFSLLSKKSIVEIKRHLYLSRHLIFTGPLSWCWAYLPIFYLGKEKGPMLAGILLSIRSIVNIANILVEQLETVVAAKFGKVAKESGKDGVDQNAFLLLKIGSLIWIFVAFILYYHGALVIELVLNKSYSPYSDLLLISWVAYGVLFLARVYGMRFRFTRETRVELVGNAIAVLSVIVSANYLIGKYSVYGAAALFVISAITILSAQFLMVHFLKKSANNAQKGFENNE